MKKNILLSLILCLSGISFSLDAQIATQPSFSSQDSILNLNYQKKIKALFELGRKQPAAMIDSSYHLIKELKAVENVHTESLAKAYYGLGAAGFLPLGEMDSAFFYLKKALVYFEDLQIPERIAAVSNALAMCHSNLGEYDHAEKYLNDCYHILFLQGDTLSHRFLGTCNNLGVLYLNLNNYPKALKYYYQCLDIAQKTKSPFYMIEGLQRNIAGIMGRLGNYQKEEEVLVSLLDSLAARDLPDYNKTKIYTSLVISHVAQKEMEEAKKYLQLAEQEIKEEHPLRDWFELYPAQGDYYKAIKDYESAAKSYEAHLQKSIKADAFVEIVVARLGLIDMNIKLERIDIAEENLKELDAITLTAQQNPMQVLERINYFKMKVAEQKGDTKAALHFSKLHILYQDSLNKITQRSESHQVEQQYLAKKSKEEVAVLEAAEKSKALTIKSQSQGIGFLVAGLVLLIILLLVGYQARKRLQRRNDNLDQTNEALAKTNIERDLMMHQVVHDLRNPLDSFKMVTELLPVLGELSEKQLKYLKLMDGELERSHELVDQLLLINKLEQSQEQVPLDSVNLEQTIPAILDPLLHRAENKEIDISVSQSSMPAVVLTHKNFFTSVLENLVSNAIKYSKKGKQIFIELRQENNFLLTSVKDQGPGFTEEDKAKLFSKYERLSNRPTGGESSTGLGLYISKLMVEKLSGSISVQTEAGQGSEFIVRIPLSLS